jgi:NAD(P)-dependent dehydrogenase (short-subunit alcohol dehydrogenase family)
MQYNLNGKTALITGASSGLGERMAQKIPLHFVGSPAELDGTILYLASNDASRYVTGGCDLALM